MNQESRMNIADKFEKKLVRKVNFSHALGVVAQTVIGLSAFVGIKQTVQDYAITAAITLAAPCFFHGLLYGAEVLYQKKRRHPDYFQNTSDINEFSYSNTQGERHSYHVVVSRGPHDVDAAALLGGGIRVTKELYDASTKDDLFFIFGHEKFHARFGHPWRTYAIRSNDVFVALLHYLAATQLAFLGQIDKIDQSIAHLGLGLLSSTVGLMVQSRTEYAADSGALLQTRDLDGAISYISKSKNEESCKPKGFFNRLKKTLCYRVLDTHPTDSARIKNLVKTAKKLGL